MDLNNKKAVIAGGVVLAILVVGIVIAAISANNTNNTSNMQPQTATSNIVELAQGSNDLSTLVAAVSAADLAGALSAEGNLTVFAPTNSAFSAIQSTVDTLLMPENKAQLQAVLQYHVVPTRALSSDLTDGQVITTLGGESLKVRIVNGVVFINNAQVITADVTASNGVVHIIDQVLVPGSFKTVVGTAIDTAALSTLVAAVQAGNLVDVLSNADANFTVFAPTNDAFAAIQSSVDTLLQPANLSQLQNVLQYHVIASEAFSTELTNGQTLQTLNGESLTVSIENGEVFIVGANSRAKVVMADVKTSNGVVHVIDTVLLP